MSSAPKRIRPCQLLGCLLMKRGNIDVVASWQDVDDLVVLDVTDRCRVARVVATESHKAGLIEADRDRLVQPLAIRL